MTGKGSSMPPNTDPGESTKGTEPYKSHHEAIAILAELGAVIKRASKHSSVYADFEKILDQKRALESQISDKNAELKGKEDRMGFLEAYRLESIDSFEKRYDNWTKKEESLRQQITSVTTNAAGKTKTALAEVETKYRKEVEKLRKELAVEKAKAESILRKLDTSKGNEARLQSQLDLSQTELRGWEGNLSILEDMDIKEFTEQFQKLVQRYLGVMRSNFLKDLPDRLLEDRPRWENLRKTPAFPLSLPASNTAAAKNARLIAALWTLSPLLRDYIFTPCGVHADASDNRAIKALLHRQLHTSVRRENMVRSLLLSAYPRDEVERAGWGAVDLAIKEGQRSVEQMLEDPEELGRNLQPVFDGFAKLWKLALYSKQFVFASTEEDSAWEWGDMPEFDDDFSHPEMLPSTSEQSNFITLNLFPRVLIPDPKEEIHSGILVWSEQNSIVASEAEFQKELYDRQTSSRGNGSGSVGPPRRPRRQSTVGGGGSSRGGSVPPGPAAGKMPGSRLPFLGGPKSDATCGSGLPGT